MKKNILSTAVLVFGLTVLSVNGVNAQSNDRQKKEPPTFSQLLEEMDKDEDGKLSKSEIKGPLKNDFDKIDTDEDGFISEAEFKKAPKPERKSRN
ncbi:EF-hand domain-containing protein [Psychroserpens sp. NJDZ02]|uniref:EF-hand domain-containing protein n=1 Tax=Psychroserpens sp. NJDZ02 TaxID=2570561 RepID=UPI0010A9488F|nr:EF-hand domain-containing protein [Psychroserpens sp. NJDZ02]QCE42197.1 EF-hand domain-containing protein [Psychroserpens sp. NJDZ02]